jgi:hypothetical protein
MSEEERLAEEARRSRDATRRLREEGESAAGEDPEPPEEQGRPEERSDGEPWAKFSTGRDPDD